MYIHIWGEKDGPVVNWRAKRSCSARSSALANLLCERIH